MAKRPADTERRRAVRVREPALLEVRISVRSRQDLQPVSVLDASCVGVGLVAPQPLPVTVGERVYLLIDFHGTPRHAPVRGSLVRAWIRRRLPHARGWCCGAEIDDLRETPWKGLAAWLERGGR